MDSTSPELLETSQQWRPLLLLFGAVVLIYHLIIYPALFSPLARIPAAHPSSHFSNIWIQWHRWWETDFEATQQAFERCGPYVRLGTMEIAVNTKEGFESIYGVGSRNMDKPTSYNYYVGHGVRNMFTSLTAAEHGHRRARMAHVYSKHFVRQSKGVRAILQTMVWGRMVSVMRMASRSTSGTLDVMPLFYAVSLDVTSAFAFGLSKAYNLIEDEQDRQIWLNIFHLLFQSRAVLLLREFRMLTLSLIKIGINILPDEYKAARQQSEDWATEKTDSTEAIFHEHMVTGQTFADGDYPLLFNAVRDGLVQDSGRDASVLLNTKQLREVASECNDHIANAGETYGLAFSYVVYQFAKHLDVQNEVRAELISAQNSLKPDTETDAKDLQKALMTQVSRLPLLNAVIREGLRLRNSRPGIDPRITPQGRTSTIGPYADVPPGVRVGAYTHLLHRSEELFTNPLEWDPYRYLKRDTGDKNPPLFAFSGGSRGCVAQHLSNELMCQALAAICMNFKLSVADESNYPSDCSRLSASRQEQLWIKFESLEDE